MSLVTIISEEWRNARKSHICSDCLNRIETGERYHCATLKYDTLYQWKSHEVCYKISYYVYKYLGAYVGDFDEGYPSFVEYIHECPENLECENIIRLLELLKTSEGRTEFLKEYDNGSSFIQTNK